jgi:hypothetical protein
VTPFLKVTGCPAYPEAVFRQLQEQGADFLLTVKANQKTLHRQILSQFQGKRHVPFVATDHEISHGRTITWTLRAKQAPERYQLDRRGGGHRQPRRQALSGQTPLSH